jgi:hypothetical protein
LTIFQFLFQFIGNFHPRQVRKALLHRDDLAFELFSGKRKKFFEGKCLLNMVWFAFDPADLVKVSPHPQVFSDIVSQRSEIGTSGTKNFYFKIRAGPGEDLERVDGNNPGGQSDDLSLSRITVKGLPLEFYGGKGRWRLRDFTPEPFQSLTNLIKRQSLRIALSFNPPFSIVGIGCDPETNGSVVSFPPLHQKTAELGCTSHKDNKKTRCVGIKGSRMPNLFDAQAGGEKVYHPPA